jgi:acyl-CoA synthetase (AMP-forming)/AMP-acid ligase II
MAIIDFFDRGWRLNPNGIAYVMDENTYTYQQIGALSCRIAHALLSRGLAHETKTAVWSLNDPIAWTCVLGAWRAGLAWVPINPRNSVTENVQLLDAFDCEVLFFQMSFWPLIESILPQLPNLKLAVCIDGSPGQVASLETFISGQPETSPAIRHEMNDVVAVQPTGGTTGTPKGVMNTHRSIQTMVAHSMMACQYGSDESVVYLAAAPMTHSTGIGSLACSTRGGTTVILRKIDPAGLCDAIARHRVTELFLPPTVIYALLSMPDIRTRDFSSLRYFLYGASPMSVEKLREAIAVFGPVMIEFYGQTECPGTVAIMRPEEHFVNGRIANDERLSSCGRTSPLIRVAIMDDTGNQCAAGVAGEICVSGDLLMKGYYKAPEKTAETIIDGWLHTGDIGHLDADGYLHITDRKKDMIISGGFNVYPSEVEQVIWSHPAVQDCAVIGVPDPKWGEAVKAVVELKPGQTVDAGELIGLCKERLSSVQAPKSVDFVPSLPRSPNGKVLKKDIRAPYWAGKERVI